MSNYHVCPSFGSKCGIATYSENIHSSLNKVAPFTLTNSIPEDAKIILLEYEYGLHQRIDWLTIEAVKQRGCKIFTLMHAVSNMDNLHRLLTKQILDISTHIFHTTKAGVDVLKQQTTEVSFVPHASDYIFLNTEKQNTSGLRLGHHGFAFRRNGLSRLVRALVTPSIVTSFYSKSTINTFNQQAGIDCTRNIQDVLSYVENYERLGVFPKDFISIDSVFSTKKEVATSLHDNSDIIILPQLDIEGYYNASGSVFVALSSGRPVVVPNTKTFSDIPDSVVTKTDLFRTTSDLVQLMKHIDKIVYDGKAVQEFLETIQPDVIGKALCERMLN